MSTTAFTWLGHACWQIESDTHSLLIDPFLTDSPNAPVSAEEVSADYILLTHGHFDHVGDTVRIAQRTGATVLANFEIAQWLVQQGVPESQTIGMNLGGKWKAPFGFVKATIAHHSSTLPDGTPGGNPNGFLIQLGAMRIYIAGDTALSFDMKLYAGELDVAILPIGDLFTMGPEDSVEALKLTEPRYVFPSHYATWPPIEQDPVAWADLVKAQTSVQPLFPKPGETVRL